MLNEIERAAIEAHARSPGSATGPPGGLLEEPISIGLRLLLEAGRLVRGNRTSLDRDEVKIKEDGSPATEIEERIELQLRELVSKLGNEAVVVGEETGGELPERGLAVAVDPIDGTWAFLTETESYSTTLALIREGRTVMGMISNPVTGELAYATRGGGARLVRLPLFGEPPAAHDLPTQSEKSCPVLVNVHPNREVAGVMNALYSAWARRDVAMIRSPGGSPAWALVEAARGHYTYVNLWSKRAAKAYDLAAGALIVREAGGDVIDLAGSPIHPLRHAGPFLAGLDPAASTRVLEIVRGGISGTTGS